MEMTQESLVAGGLTQEQAKAVLDAHKTALTDKYVPKARLDEATAERDKAKELVKERDTQIAGLKKFEGDATALQTKVAELESIQAILDSESPEHLFDKATFITV